MSNENKTNSTTHLLGSNITPTETGIMFFLAFEGIFCLGWLVTMFFGYSFEIAKPVNYIKILCTPFFLYIIFKALRSYHYSLRCFAGLSWTILIILFIVYSHQCIENWFWGKRPIIGLFLLLMFPILVTAFSIPINKKIIRNMFYVVFIPVFIISINMIFLWHDWILKGLSIRNLNFRNEEALIINTCWTTTDGGFVFTTGMLGALLGLMSLAGYYNKQIHCFYFIIAYSIGTILVCFSAYKTIYLAWISVNILIFITGKFKKKILYILIPSLLIINIISFYQVGKNDDSGIKKRVIDFGTRQINKDRDILQQLLTKESDLPYKEDKEKKQVPDTIVTDKKQTITKIHDLYEHHPLLLQNRPRLGNINDYKSFIKDTHNINPRITLTLMTLDATLSNPIWGYGFSLIVNVNSEYVRLSPHSNITTMFLSTGIIGGILFIIVIIRGFIDSFIVCRNIPDYSWIAAIFLFSFISNIFDTRVISFNDLWLPLVILRTCVKTQSKEQNIDKDNEIDNNVPPI